jgi:hypothetical protein
MMRRWSVTVAGQLLATGHMLDGVEGGGPHGGVRPARPGERGRTFVAGGGGSGGPSPPGPVTAVRPLDLPAAAAAAAAA